MSDENDLPTGAFIVALAFIVLAILYMPLLTIWCINTLVVVPCHGEEIPYAFFTKYWVSALLCSGVLSGLIGANSAKKQ